ncbi:MAG: large subunit ribosomal protein L6 [Marinoscillum sp.]|jgi:large subunit ribosomal protein L6
MSRIGKAPITIPNGITINVDKNVVSVKGPKGELKQNIDPDMIVSIEDGVLTVQRPTEQKRHKAMHGLYRSLINNMVTGVTSGYKKQMELVGVGFKAAVQNNILELNLGYSHNIFLTVPSEITVGAETTKGQNPKVTVEGIDKQLVGQVSAKIKSLRKVEPYKGKGIRFIGEQVRRKAGKTAAK